MKRIGEIGEGGQGVSTVGPVGENLKDLLLAVRAEMDDLRAKYAALLAYFDESNALAPTDHSERFAAGAKQFDK